jgi:GTP-binding protein EngB required for normal cell division
MNPALADRFDALGRFLRVVSPHLDGVAVPQLDPGTVPAAQALVRRASTRIALGQADSGAYTVVALAGATGSGKSSLFNALAGLDLSRTGPLRPTTATAHACVWGTAGAGPLLDWLGVDPARRYGQESALDPEGGAPLRGLVLLDLPDLDSIAVSHRAEADRLLDVVDLVVWVLDPQKYADAAVHEEYLRRLGGVAEVTVVAFNQIDRLGPADTARCVADLRALVAADGLPRAPVVATSARTGAGVAELRDLLERVVVSRRAGLVRLQSELEDALAALAPLIGPDDRTADPGTEEPADRVSRAAVAELAGEFATAVGVTAVAAQAGYAYLDRAAMPGWPLNRRPSSTVDSGQSSTVDESEVPAADPARVGFAVRRLAATTSAGLPAPWPDEVRLAASAGAHALPDELGRAVRAARPAPPPALGWRFARIGFWLAVAAVVAGVGWLVRSGIDRAAPIGAWLLIGAGAAVAIGVVAVGRWVRATGARRWRGRTERRLRDATTSVAREAVAPVRAVLRDYAEAQRAFEAARR